jgi:hypothetical protein
MSAETEFIAFRIGHHEVAWSPLPVVPPDSVAGRRPQARLVTTFLGAGIMSLERPVPMDRMYLLNPGQTLDVGDRTLTAFRPPLFDNPSTVGFYDDRSRTCFTSDCFGAPVSSAELAGCSDVGEVPGDALRAGQLLWAAVDSPWVHTTDAAAFLDTT